VAASSAFRNKNAFLRLREVVQQFAGLVVVDHRARGHFDLEIRTVAAMPVTALTLAATLGSKGMIKAKF